MSLADVRSARSSPAPDACPECDTGASVTSDLHKYQVACTCKPASAQYACADDPGPPAPAKTDTPPALPPRPPTNVLAATNRRNNVLQYQVSTPQLPQATIANDVAQHYVPPPPYFAPAGCEGGGCRRRKYAWWCCGCGALAAALGGLLAAQHILLRAYTASPHHLETVPAAVPAAMLVLTGVCIMSLARRRNRYSYMIKVVGACCLVCALTCVLVTITTTVIHMNKLQTLKFCEYTKLTRTCTCFSMSPDVQHSASDDDGSRCVFEGVADCGVVHGALYWCLRGVFALSVSAVLVCIFSCMLAYQLLSHERKKMYWEQLELRCRSLYRAPAPPAAPAQNTCSCCTQCHTAQPAWDFSLQHRFWAPGRIGNLYSPNPGTGRKMSPWSWFPWPRGNSQNSSRCRARGAAPSGDSAYGFCESEAPPAPYLLEQRATAYPPTPTDFPQNPTGFAQTSAAFGQSSNFQGYPQSSSFVQAPGMSGGFAEGVEVRGSFDAQTGVWGPPPPYSPQGRSAGRHHLHHQDPAAATLLHHHHIDPRNSLPVQTHTCSRNYLHGNSIQEMTRLNPELSRMNPEMGCMYPNDPDEIARLQEMVSMGERFNTLRGQLVPYRGCPRSGLSAGHLHADCRDDIAIECLHQKSVSKVSDQSSDSCQKLGKENLGFQNDKHSPIRSVQDCARAQNTESEVYFADVSSCCNADCCINPPVSALVGTIETHPESTSESDTSSFTLTRQQRPQPQVGSKRRPRQTDKHTKTQEKIRQEFHGSMRLTEQQIEHLNSSMRLERVNDSRISERMADVRMSDRMIDARIERMNESRESRDRLNERVDRMIERETDRMNESRVDRASDSRDRLNESRSINDRDRLNDSRIDRVSDRDRLNDSRVDRVCDRERINDSRVDRLSDRDRMNDSRVDRVSDRDRMNDSRVDRVSDRDRMNDSRVDRLSDRDRMNDSRVDRVSDRERMNDSRVDRVSDRERMNDSRIDRVSDRSLNDSRFEDRRMSDLNASLRIEGSPKMRSHMSPLRMPRTSPKLKDPPRQTGPDPKDFFPQNLSPLSPNTEESLLSDDDDRRQESVYSNEPEAAKCLAPDSQYEPPRESKPDGLKLNHHHCYSDTNTMDSGWQSGSEKQVTD